MAYGAYPIPVQKKGCTILRLVWTAFVCFALETLSALCLFAKIQFSPHVWRAMVLFFNMTWYVKVCYHFEISGFFGMNFMLKMRDRELSKYFIAFM